MHANVTRILKDLETAEKAVLRAYSVAAEMDAYGLQDDLWEAFAALSDCSLDVAQNDKRIYRRDGDRA